MQSSSGCSGRRAGLPEARARRVCRCMQRSTASPTRVVSRHQISWGDMEANRLVYQVRLCIGGREPRDPARTPSRSAVARRSAEAAREKPCRGCCEPLRRPGPIHVALKTYDRRVQMRLRLVVSLSAERDHDGVEDEQPVDQWVHLRRGCVARADCAEGPQYAVFRHSVSTPSPRSSRVPRHKIMFSTG